MPRIQQKGSTLPTPDQHQVAGPDRGVTVALFAGIVGHSLLNAVLSIREEQFRMSGYVDHVIVCGYERGSDLLLRALQDELSDDEAKLLRERHCVLSGETAYWIEPSGRLRKERASRLYYIQTPRGVYRYSKISGELVEV